MIQRREHAARLVGVALPASIHDSEAGFEAGFRFDVNPFLSLRFDLDSPHGRRESNPRADALMSRAARAALAGAT